jgi:tight adherence protein B
MTPILLFSVAIGGLVATVCGVAIMMLQRQPESVIEDRLTALTSSRAATADKAIREASALLSSPLNDTQTLIEEFCNNFFNLQRLLDQADIKLPLIKFVAIVGFVGIALVGVAAVFGVPLYLAPLLALLPPAVAYFFLTFKRKRRIDKFVKQLPEALDLLGRSLRSGHSLGSGFGLIAGEMTEPIKREFGRCFEEQNLGIPLEEALRNMCGRIPSMDLRFMVTSIVLQRQTGGDLVEILEKISRLIRERFKLAGQINALTGEGRLSGIVLFLLPPGLFVSTYFLNREYVMSLFDEPTGRWMVAGAIVMQLIGAYVIRKIVDIKV